VGDLDIFHSLTINVTGGVSATIGASAGHNDRIIQVRGVGAVVNLSNLIIQGGDTQSTTPAAGCGLRAATRSI